MSSPPDSVRRLLDELQPDLNETQRHVLAIQTTSRKRLDELFSEICHAGTKDTAELRSMLIEDMVCPPTMSTSS